MVFQNDNVRPSKNSSFTSLRFENQLGREVFFFTQEFIGDSQTFLEGTFDSIVYSVTKVMILIFVTLKKLTKVCNALFSIRSKPLCNFKFFIVAINCLSMSRTW